MRTKRQRTAAGGQAIIELTVALIAILALTVGLLLIARLGRAHNEIMIEARREAGLAALNPLAAFAPAESIRDWSTGPDGKPLTRDDVAQPDTPDGLRRRIVERAAANADDWEVLSAASRTHLPDLRGHPRPASVFGLVRGYERTSVPLISAVQHLFYNAEHIELEADVWMTHTDNIY